MTDRGYPTYSANDDLILPAQGMSTAETGDMVDTGEDIVFGHLRLRTERPVHYQSVVVFPRKVTFGETSAESDDYFSTIVWNNLAGGSGVYDINEVSDINRHWHSEMYTRYPGSIMKPLLCTTVSIDPTGGEHRWIGDLWDATRSKYIGFFAIGPDIYSTLSNTPFDTLVNTALSPDQRGVVFRGTDLAERLVFPGNAAGAGYSTIEMVAGSPTLVEVPDDATHPAVLSLALFENKIMAIDWDGQLWDSVSLTAGWNPIADCLLPEGPQRAHLVEFFNRQGDETVWVVTNKTAMQYVGEGPGLINIPNLKFPARKYSGYAARAFNDDLMIASHMGVVKYAGGSTSYVGLDRDHGLPIYMRGHIVDIVSGWQGMYAFVQAEDTDGHGQQLYCSVHEWSGTGWHEMWRGTDLTITPNSAAITQYGDEKYRLVWGGTNAFNEAQFRYIDLHLDTSNPRDLSQFDYFMPGEFETEFGWFDLNLTGYIKLGNAAEIKLEGMHEDATAFVYIKYDDEENDWHLLGSTKRNGISSFSMGDTPGDVARGQHFERARLKVRIKDWTQKTPVIRYVIISCLKEGYPAMSYTISLDLTKDHHSLSPQVIARELRRMKDEGHYLPFVYGGELRRAKMTQLYGDGKGGTGQMLQGAGFALIELPEGVSKAWYQRERVSQTS